jgi:hypothetical protein
MTLSNPFASRSTALDSAALGRWAVTSLATLAVLGTVGSPARAAGKAPAVVYASAQSSVNTYSENLSVDLPTAQLTSSIPFVPGALTVDAPGNLWVVNPAAFDQGENAGTGTVSIATSVYDYAVVNSTISEYAHGSTTPFLKLTGFASIGGMAVDAQNDLYVSFTSNSAPGAHIRRFRARQRQSQQLNVALNSIGGLAIDASGNLVAFDPGAQKIDVFAAHSWKLLRTIAVDSPAAPESSIALDRNGSHLYVVVGGGSYGQSGIFVYDYASGRQAGDITAGFFSSFPASGLAVSPGS